MLIACHNIYLYFFYVRIDEDRNNNIKITSLKASANIIESLASEQMETKERSLDLQNFSGPFRKAGVTVVSIASDFCKFIGMNKSRQQSEEINNNLLGDIISDDAKLRALKQELRNKGLCTNVAIKQYLLKHYRAKKFHEQRYKRRSNCCVSSAKVRINHQSCKIIEKDEHGFEWNPPAQASGSRFKNVRAARSA